MFKRGNTDELKDKINKLWNNKGLCEKYSHNCKNTKFDTIES